MDLAYKITQSSLQEFKTIDALPSIPTFHYFPINPTIVVIQMRENPSFYRSRGSLEGPKTKLKYYMVVRSSTQNNIK